MSNTEQGAIVSCETSSSKSSVNGKTIIRSPSKEGLELENFINPELTWKSIAKGYRSSSRRARRHALRNFVAGEKLSVQGSMEVGEGPASDTEMHGVAILRRRFSDKIWDIPLKKRRLMLRSPSPPPTSHQEASKLDSLSEKLSKAGEDSAKVDTQQRSEDFSGLQILAAVETAQVDNGNFRSVVLSIRDRIGSSPEDNVCEAKGKGSSLSDGNGNAEGSGEKKPEEVMEGSSETDVSETSTEQKELEQTGIVLPKSPINKEIGFGEGSGAVKDTRMLWDLNVPADAWENFSQSCAIGLHVNASTCLLSRTEERVEVLNNSQVNLECKKTQNSVVDSVSEDAKEPFTVSADTKESLPEIHEASNRQDGFDNSAEIDRDSESRVCSVSDAKDSCKIAGATCSLDHLDRAKISADDGNACPKIKGVIKALSSDGTPAKVSSTGDTLDDSYGSDVYQTEKVDMNSTERGEELLDGYDSQFEDGELREADAPYYSDKNIGEDRAVKQVDYGSGSDDGILGLMPMKEVEAERLSTPASCETTRKPEISNAEIGTARDDSTSLESSDKGLPPGFVGIGSSQVDESASFIDGQVDYGSECDEGLLELMQVKEVEAERLSTPGSCQTTRKTELSNCEMGTAREDSASTKSSDKGLPAGFVGIGGNQVDESASFINGPPEAMWRNRSENCRNLFPRDEADVRPKRYFGRDRHFDRSTANWNLERRYSPNRAAHTYDRPRPKGFVEGRRFMMPSDRMDSQTQRFVGFENRVSRQFANSREHIMRRQSPSFRGEDSYGPNPRMFPPREMSPEARNQFRRFPNSRGSIREAEEFMNSFPADATNHYSGYNAFSERDRSISPGFENRVGRQFANSREHIMRRRSPGFTGKDSYGLNSRMFPQREMSPQERNQFRRFRGSIREEEFRNSFPEVGYNGLSKRDRSISPQPHGRPPYSRSRSRSRIRSPPNYLQQREQRDVDGSLMRSRSPGSNRGVRIPFQKRFTARYEDRDQPRRQFQPNHMRPFDDRSGGGFVDFRARKSPVRMYHQRQPQQGNNRFDSIRGNNSDEFRPVMQQQPGDFRDARHRFEMSRNNAAAAAAGEEAPP